MMNETTRVSTTGEIASLNYYLEHLPGSGASGLLYVTVERPYEYGYKYTVRVQCFGANGKMLWEEKESHTGWSETGGTNGVIEIDTARISEQPLEILLSRRLHLDGDDIASFCQDPCCPQRPFKRRGSNSSFWILVCRYGFGAQALAPHVREVAGRFSS